MIAVDSEGCEKALPPRVFLGSNGEELAAIKCLPSYPSNSDIARCSRHVAFCATCGRDTDASSSVALPYGLTRSAENRYADLADKRTRLSESCPSTDPLVAKGQPKVASATAITCKNQRLQKLTCVSRVSQQRRCTPRESTREEVHASYTHD
jgi:hypothetical protein